MFGDMHDHFILCARPFGVDDPGYFDAFAAFNLLDRQSFELRGVRRHRRAQAPHGTWLVVVR